MRRGAFEECDGEGDQRNFRLKWGEEVHRLTTSEVSHAKFIRYLICRGKLNEYWESQGCTEQGA